MHFSVQLTLIIGIVINFAIADCKAEVPFWA